jgi:hypothetical protein
MTDATTEGQDMTSQSRFGVRIDPGISLGHVVTMLPSLFLVIWFLSGKMSSVDSTQNDMKAAQTDIKQLRVDVTAQLAAASTAATAQYTAFKTEMVAQMTQQQVNIDRQFSATRDTINNIPSMAERVSQLEKTLDWRGKQQDQDHSATVENTTNINNYLRDRAGSQKIQR